MQYGRNLHRYCGDSPVVFLDASGLCKVCSSGIRYRVSIADLDAFMVGTPYQDLADRGIGSLTGGGQYLPRHMVAPRRTETGPFRFWNPRFTAQGTNFAEKTWVAGHFLLFVDWEICDTNGPCGLRVKETVTNQREGGTPIVNERQWNVPTAWVKKPRTNPVGGCGTTLIYLDIPGWFAQLRPVQGTPAAWAKITVDQTLEVYNVASPEDPVSTQHFHVEITIDRAGNVSATP